MKYIYSVIGFVSVLLGFIGIFLPVLPHPQLGPYIKSFREDKSIPLRIKVISVGTLWITAVHCIVFIFDTWWLKLFMGVLATCITLYILSFKSRKNKCQD